jgi:acetylornithine/succinyldiaminopimelate/putrescine aminotransferase
MATAPLLEFGRRHVAKGLNRLTEDIIRKGEGSWITMHGGRKLLDFTCGIGVTNLGASGKPLLLSSGTDGVRIQVIVILK